MSAGRSLVLLGVLGLAAVGLVLLLRDAGPDRRANLRLVQEVRAGRLSFELHSDSWMTSADRSADLADGSIDADLPALLRESFDGALEPTWMLAKNAADLPLTPPSNGGHAGATDPTPFRLPEVVTRNDDRVLLFEKPEGAAFLATEATADTPYLFRAHIRRPGAARSEAMSGIVALQELGRPLDPGDGSLSGLAARIREARPIGKPYLLAAREDGAADSILFRSSVYTRAFLVALLGGLPGDTSGVGVSFDDVVLTALPLERYLAYQDRSLNDELAGPAPASRDEELTPTVKMLGELRDAFLLPDSTQVGLSIDIPTIRPVLEFGFGVIEERTSTFGRQPTLFDLEVVAGDGSAEQVFSGSVDPSSGVDRLGWHDRVVDLKPWAGQRVTLKFHASSSPGSPGPRDVGAIGAPIVRSLGPQQEPAEAADPRPLSVLLISLDTLRSDHLGLYGYERPTSPFIDRFFTEQGQYLSEFVAASSYTLPSHASIFTGQHPSVHGVHQFDRRLVQGVNPMLTTLLRDAGYLTAAFTGGGFVGYEYGFRAGFDRFSIIDPLLTAEDRYRNHFPRSWDRPFNDAVYRKYDLDRVLGWITDRKDAPFFLFLHSFVAHNYSPPPGVLGLFDAGCESELGIGLNLHEIDTNEEKRRALAPTDLDHLVHLYDATIRVADSALERLVAHLEAEGLLEQTILIVTSDHGEEFQEHGGLLHGRTLYEEQVRIPLLVRLPESLRSTTHRPGRVEAAGHHVDLAPTILDLLGLEPDPLMEGISLAPILAGESPTERTLLSELDAIQMGEMQAVRLGAAKLIETTSTSKSLPELAYRHRVGFEFFDLGLDPAERDDRIESDDPAIEGLKKRLLALRRQMEARRARMGSDGSNQFELTEAARQRLKNLGYLQGDP